MTQEELAKRLQTSGKNISDLLHGKINLTDEMALRLSIVFGTSVSMWLNLNQNYSEKKLEIERRMQEDADSFANNLLVPDEKYDVFLSNKVFSEDSIRKFAIEIDTTPEIVMRRMQRERLSNYALLLKKIKK